MAKKLSEKRQTRHEAFQSYPAIPIPIPRLDVHLLYLYLCLCLCLFSAIHSSVVVLSFSFSSWSWSHHRCHQHKTKININPGGVARMVASNAAAAVAVTEESASTKTAQSIRSGSSSSNSNSNNSTNHHKIYNNNDDDDDDFDVLASLFGSPAARDAFFANDFGTNVVHVSRATCGSNANVNANANNSNNNNNNSTTTTSTLRDLDAYLPCIDSDSGRMDMKVLFDTTNYIALRKRGSLNYLDKATTGYDEFCEYIRDSGSAVIPVAEENALMPFRGAVEDELREQLLQQTRNRNGAGVGEDNDNDNSDGVNTVNADGNNASANASEVCSVGINVYHSGPNAVALTRHFDQYDVFVLHLDGQKEWEIGVFPPPAEYDIGSHLKHPMEALEAVVEWKNVTLVEGDLLYIPKGIFHAATTAEGYDSTTHATIGLEY